MVEQLQRVRTVHDHYPKGNIKGLLNPECSQLLHQPDLCCEIINSPEIVIKNLLVLI